MRLHADWRHILLHAWSVRLIAIAAFLSGIEVILPIIGYALPVSPFVLAAISFLVVSGALVSRVLVQEKFGAS
jgi:hypothetical protein